MATDCGVANNKAAWLHGINDLRVEPYQLDSLGDNQVRVQIAALGICGSDVHYLKHGRIAHFVVEAPMVIGHEAAGVITKVGSAVKQLKPGDRVALEPGIPCRCCGYCRGGTYNLCEGMQFHATPPVHGSLAQFINHPADFCFKLPDSMSLEEGAMCEPISVGVHACKRAGVTFGSNVAILGAGPIGLVTLLVAKAYGATSIAITDISTDRLKCAKELGASVCIDVSKMPDPKTVAAAIESGLGGVKADVVVDCVGLESSMLSSIQAAKSGGKVCLVGMGHNEMTLPMTSASIREVDIIGVFRYRNAYPTAIEMIGSGAINVQPLITHRYDLTSDFSAETILKGFETSAKGLNAIKVMFNLLPAEKQ